jgi:Flp pilus assembly protein TadG
MAFRILRSLWRDGEGSALIESAIILPVLFALVFGVFEFSWLIGQRHLISTGVRDAARYIARSATPNDPTITKGAKRLATTGAIDGTTARVAGWKADDVNIAYDFISNPVAANGLTNFRGGPVIETVTVSTTFTVPSLGFFGLLGLSPPVFTVSHQERVIGSA